ncbi:5-oxoprolinase/urea amidolyase family protein [Salinisphaera sp. SPP-AMP-43]|uniref:5-oxoprolinase subunit B/C family protein n=1 Tax=Salinisphaera sp. SPP-AMP-43 TaxID=3121288 RepID=UPI003C6E2DDA
MSRARGYRWAGAQNLLFELDSLDDVLALHACLRDQPLPGQIDLVPAACTLLIKYDTYKHAAQAAERVLAIDAAPVAADSGRVHEIEVIYDGEDLADVAEQTGLASDAVIEAHTRQSWRAAFSGFAPGFVYLVGDDERLKVSRRDSPRTAVPPGAVGLAGAFSAIYPRESPGGWQLIGRTNAPIWDLEREPPALIQAGDTIRYIAVEAFSASTTPSNEPETLAPTQAERVIEITAPGMQSLIQDLGRPGLAHLGVAASGAADEPAFRQANRLVGNLPGEAVIETVLGGLALTARGNLVLARTGAHGPADIRSPQGARTAPACAPFALHDGETLTLSAPEAGLRSYLAVRGGLDIAPVLHSRSRDALAGIGPKPLAAGDMLPVAPAGVSHVVGQPEPSALAAPADDGITVLRVVLGPRDDWFDADTLARLTRLTWQPSQQSNRVGLRLNVHNPANNPADDDGRLQRAREGELPSEGCVAGAIQVPPSGQPVLFLKDHPVTGGYPVIGVVWPSDLSRAAQLAPGQPLRFAIVTPDGQPVAPAQGSNP